MKVIQLTQGKVTLVDDDDYDLLIQRKWYALRHNPTFYARNRIGSNMQFMHQFLMKVEKPLMVDHIDGDGLNNQRSNLRVVTAAQNCANRKKSSKTSGKYKGLYYYKKDKLWGSSIVVNGKRNWLGCYKDEVMAAKAYDTAAIKYFGEYAKLNFEKGIL